MSADYWAERARILAEQAETVEPKAPAKKRADKAPPVEPQPAVEPPAHAD